MIRAYAYPHFANKGKVEKIRKVLKEYRKTAQNIANYQWYLFYKKGNFWQVVSLLEGFVSNIQNEFKRTVLASLDQKTKRVLLYLSQIKPCGWKEKRR